MIRDQGVLIIQLQRINETGTQLIEEMKRSAEEGDMSANRLAAGETGDSLVHDSLEY